MIWALFLCVVLALVGYNMSSPELFSIHIPARQRAGTKSPVLLMLHGVGSNEQDLVTLAKHFDPRFKVYSLRAPLVLSSASFAWFHVNFTAQGPIHNKEEAEASRLLLKNFILKLKEMPDVDPEQIFLLGFSQGAIMNLSLAFTEPDLVKGVVAISGRTLQEVQALAKDRTYQVSPKVLLVHGIHDSKLPLFHGETSDAVLSAAKFDHEFKKYNANHEITFEMIQDIQKWLSSQLIER